MNRKFQKNKKELLFLEPIKPEMSVETIFTNLVRILEEKGIKINTNEAPKKGVGKWKKLTQVCFMKTLKVL